jgi:transcriptional regulator with XRE-family HTH domain
MRDSQGLLDRRKLRDKRIRAGLTQPALAVLVGIDASHVSMLERGKRGTSPKTLCTLARVLGCDISDLMPDEEAA